MAARWYEKSAQQGNADAQVNLGVLFYEGRGVCQDHVEAHTWWSIAEASGNSDAASNRAVVERSMKSTEIVEAQRKAAEWLEAHSNKERRAG